MMTLPGISQLETTSEAIRMLLDGTSDEQAQWKPAADRWSIAEVLEHLSHVEGHCFRARVEAMVTQVNPPIPEYDQDVYAAAGTYSGRDPEDSLAHFEEQREDNIAYLNNLPLSVAGRTGEHEKLGSISVSHLLNEWAFHDLAHIRQLAELVRCVRYFPEMGPLREGYTVRP